MFQIIAPIAKPFSITVAKNNTDFKYREWWFVVTDKYAKGDYEKLGTTFTRGEIKGKIAGLFR